VRCKGKRGVSGPRSPLADAAVSNLIQGGCGGTCGGHFHEKEGSVPECEKKKTGFKTEDQSVRVCKKDAPRGPS